MAAVVSRANGVRSCCWQNRSRVFTSLRVWQCSRLSVRGGGMMELRRKARPRSMMNAMLITEVTPSKKRMNVCMQ